MIKSDKTRELEFELLRRGYRAIKTMAEVRSIIPGIRLPRSTEVFPKRWRTHLSFAIDKLDGV